MLRLLLGSALMLFLELALIRWLGANIVHLSYFTNFVLLGSFLGIGVGFLISRKSWSILPWTPVLLAVLVVGGAALPGVDRPHRRATSSTSPRSTPPARRPGWCCRWCSCWCAAILAGPAEVVGRCFAQLPPLTAYRWDLVGSLIGISGFTAAVVPAGAVGGLGRAGRGRRS